MSRSGRRHAQRRVSALRAVVWWSVPSAVIAAIVLIYAGVDTLTAVGVCGGLLAIVVIVYALDRSGLMRPPTVERDRPIGPDDAAHDDPDR